MPSMRRVKVFGLLVLVFVITILFWTGSARQDAQLDPRTAGDFFEKTMSGLNRKPMRGATKSNDDEEVAKKMAERLKEAAQVARDNANAKAPNKPDPPSSVVGVGSAAEGAGGERSVAGRKKFTAGDEQKPVKEETQEDHDIEVELNSILKKSPSKSTPTTSNLLKVGTVLIVMFNAVIIFSKSYCPHSREAKDILIGKYIIEPAPFVVELDQHPLGAGLQARLAELTGRRTVPNVLINAVSIGGGDDVVALDQSHELIAKIQELGGKKITKAEQKPAEEIDHGLK
jgi:glutaredoxin